MESAVFCLDGKRRFVEIPIEHAYDGMQRLCPLRENEQIWRACGAPFGDETFAFQFEIETKCTTRNKVGYYVLVCIYKLIRDAGGLRFVVGEARREFTGEGPHVAQLFELAHYR